MNLDESTLLSLPEGRLGCIICSNGGQTGDLGATGSFPSCTPSPPFWPPPQSAIGFTSVQDGRLPAECLLPFLTASDPVLGVGPLQLRRAGAFRGL